MLVVLVLITSLGLTVQHLTRRMSRRSTVANSVASRAELRGCIDELAAATPKVKDDCCDFSKLEHKLSSPAHELAAKVLMPGPSMSAIVPPLSWPVAPAAGTSRTGTGPRWFAADGLAPTP